MDMIDSFGTLNRQLLVAIELLCIILRNYAKHGYGKTFSCYTFSHSQLSFHLINITNYHSTPIDTERSFLLYFLSLTGDGDDDSRDSMVSDDPSDDMDLFRRPIC